MTSARALIEQASAVLLDFDGPVCSVFAGLPPDQVAAAMRERLGALDPTAGFAATSDDPLDVLRTARDHSSAAGALAEELLRAAELDAVVLAEPTDGSRAFLESMHARGTPVAIVSNNGEQAICEYLRSHSLADLVTAVSARDPLDARLMKPHPKSLYIAMSQLQCNAASTVMVGDSESDIVAARASQVRVVAYANKAGKARLFAAAHADAIVSSMQELVS